MPAARRALSPALGGRLRNSGAGGSDAEHGAFALRHRRYSPGARSGHRIHRVLVWSLPLLLAYTNFPALPAGSPSCKPVAFALVSSNLINVLATGS